MRVGAFNGLILAGLAACAPQSEAPVIETAAMPTSGGSCEDLAKLSLPNAAITTAEAAGAGVGALPAPPAGAQPAGPPQLDISKLPAFCRVAASLMPSADSDIRIEVWMPAQEWNGKFLGTGNGGASGSIGYAALADGLRRGYATAATDTGHRGGAADYSFALGHPEKVTDNAWRAVHEMTVTAKALVKGYYAAAPKLSYWSSCSTGGRQGLKEAQRFPEDYDGIVAGAPAYAWPGLQTWSMLLQQAMTDKAKGLPPAKLSVLKEAAIKACDAADGIADRIVNEPDKCSFDPAVTQCKSADGKDCLTKSEVEAARRLYAGVVNPQDPSMNFPSSNPGSETGWAALGGAMKIGESYFRDVVHGDPNWTAAKFDLPADMALARKVDAGEMDASSPDIAAFQARGGKLILYHGLTDGLIPSGSTVNYYRSLEAKDAAGTAANVRMFLMPGVDHCRGGEGPSSADFLGALEQWVEQGTAPEMVTASGNLPGGEIRTRPLCAYPNVAKYSGSGSTDEAANFSCAAP